MGSNNGVIKQIIRYTVTSVGDYTKSGLSIDPNKTIVLINGGGYDTYNNTYLGYLVDIKNSYVITRINANRVANYSVQVIEFC